MKSNTSMTAARAKPRRTKEERDRKVGINDLAANVPRRRAASGTATETVEQFKARGGKVQVLPSAWDQVAA